MEHHPSILINSHTSNAVAVDTLLKSMRENRMVNAFKLIIVIGGHSEYSHETRDGVLYVHANHNSIDNTALIAVLEYPLLSYYSPFVYLHDTCLVGRKFFERIGSLPVASSIRMTACSPSMNIGLYTKEVLEAQRPFLMSMKVTNPFMLLDMKRRAIETEDFIFTHDPSCVKLPCELVIEEPSDPYKTGTVRRVEHYSSFDLYKLKANWGVGPLVMAL
jgi:hypothetical protein